MGIYSYPEPKRNAEYYDKLGNTAGSNGLHSDQIRYYRIADSIRRNKEKPFQEYPRQDSNLHAPKSIRS